MAAMSEETRSQEEAIANLRQQVERLSERLDEVDDPDRRVRYARYAPPLSRPPYVELIPSETGYESGPRGWAAFQEEEDELEIVLGTAHAYAQMSGQVVQEMRGSLDRIRARSEEIGAAYRVALDDSRSGG